MFSDKDKEAIKEIIKELTRPITKQYIVQTQAVSDINDNLGTIKTDIAIVNTKLENIERHLEKQNGRLDKTENKIEIVKTACAKHQNNWGWTRRIVLWIISASGLIGLTIAVIKIFNN